MTFTSNRDIDYIYTGVIARTLPKSEWTHAAHFAAAVAIFHDKDRNAFRDMPYLIKSYNLSTGTPNTDTDGYHHTITLASLMAVQNSLENAPKGSTLYEITNQILAQEFGHSNWLLDYWRKPLLFSVRARKEWVPPDIQSLPFKTDSHNHL